MNYYYDTEFLEGTQKKWFGKTKPTIDLISIGIVSEDGREYYAISKDFNLKEAWNRYDLVDYEHSVKKVYWIRENVLRPIYYEMIGKDINFHDYDKNFSYSNFKRLIKLKGKTNKQIADEIKSFTMQYSENENEIWDKPTFYAYFADYDWVVFCQLFGTMMDLPNGFPMYCKDLKQILDEKVSVFCAKEIQDTSFKSAVKRIKMHKDYPKQTNEHNALADAKWAKNLHNFLNNL